MPFDRAAFLKLVDGDPALFAELHDLYSQDWPQTLKKLEQALLEGQSEMATRLAHRLKGMVRNFYATPATQICAEVEDLILETKLEEAMTRLPDVKEALKGLDEALEREKTK